MVLFQYVKLKFIVITTHHLIVIVIIIEALSDLSTVNIVSSTFPINPIYSHVVSTQ